MCAARAEEKLVFRGAFAEMSRTDGKMTRRIAEIAFNKWIDGP
jgi:hypothetical protein